MSFRLLIAVFLLVALFYFVGAPELIATLKNIQLEFVVYLLLLAVVLIWASCLKWQLFVRAGGHNVPILHLMKLYTVGYFFNVFTPSYIGGDVARSFHLGRYLENQRDAFVATFLERFTGLVAMSLLGLIFVAVGTEATAGVELAILVVGTGVLLLAVVCFSKTLCTFAFSLSKKVLRRIGRGRWPEKLIAILDKIDEGMGAARANWSLVAKALLLSLFFHVLAVFNTYVAARAVGWENPDLGGLFVVVPLVLLVSMAPITPSGLGIQEGAFLFFLERIGGTRGQGLGVGLVLRAKVMLVAVCGGLLWLSVRKQDSKRFAVKKVIPSNATTLAETDD